MSVVSFAGYGVIPKVIGNVKCLDGIHFRLLSRRLRWPPLPLLLREVVTQTRKRASAANEGLLTTQVVMTMMTTEVKTTILVVAKRNTEHDPTMRVVTNHPIGDERNTAAKGRRNTDVTSGR